ncbi:MAG: DUF5372 family protein, partial [Gammaproteobacteria bacterium]
LVPSSLGPLLSIGRRCANAYLNACKNRSSKQIFRVTHPFHPLFGQEFSVLFQRCIGGEDYLFFDYQAKRNANISARWTSLGSPNPYVVISDGRSLFCPKDLLELVQLTRDIKSVRKRRYAKKVKK